MHSCEKEMEKCNGAANGNNFRRMLRILNSVFLSHSRLYFDRNKIRRVLSISFGCNLACRALCYNFYVLFFFCCCALRIYFYSFVPAFTNITRR